MRWLLSNVAGGIIRWIVPTFISVACVMLGVVPVELLADVIAAPPWWFVHPLFRVGIVLIGVVIAVSTILYRQQTKPTEVAKLNYLGARDYELGQAIILMALRSAWGKWYMARDFLTTGVPIDLTKFVDIAASDVKPKILDGDLVVRGRPRGQTSYEIIPRTDWRDTAIHFIEDPITIWKLQVIPSGVDIDRDGTVRPSGNLEKIAHLSRYDSLLVDSHQFERLWPQTDVVADKQRRKLLKEARRKKLHSETIKSLSD